MLERAIEIAAQAHRGQRAQAGGRGILHPLRVMMACSPGDARIVGVLHDVVEDGVERTFDRLHEAGPDAQVLRALDAVPKRDGEGYSDLTDRTGQDPIACEVKVADLRDDVDLTRIPDPTAHDHERLRKREASLQRLTALRPLPWSAD